MNNPESVQENETYKILWNFEIQTDHLIFARRPHLAIVKNKKKTKKQKNCRMANFVAPADHWVKLKKSRKRDKYLYLARELKKKNCGT